MDLTEEEASCVGVPGTSLTSTDTAVFQRPPEQTGQQVEDRLLLASSKSMQQRSQSVALDGRWSGGSSVDRTH